MQFPENLENTPFTFEYFFVFSSIFLFPPVDLHWFFEISIRTEKKNSVRTEKKFSYKLTEFLSQFEINAKMDISKNQWRSTGGLGGTEVTTLTFE